MSRICASLIILMVTVCSIRAAVKFEREVAFEGAVVHAAQAADYNGDGVNMALAPDCKVRQVHALPKPFKPASIYSNIMDVDGDGDMDFLGTNNGLYWLECPDDLVTSEGHGIGITLFKGPDYKTSRVDEELEAPHTFQVADIEGDGDVDLFVCAKGSRKAQWFENDGKGNFTRHILSDDQESYDIFITDLDSDGDLDVVIAGQRSKNIVFFKQQSH